MSDNMIEKYRKAGKITSKVRKMALDKINPNMKVIDLIEGIERKIIKLGGIPAFPCNVSINEITAHYTSPPNDETVLKFGDLVKIDLGSHVDGYIADTAISTIVGGEEYLDSSDIDEEKISKNLDMIETSILAVESAISTIRDGVEVGKVGDDSKIDRIFK